MKVTLLAMAMANTASVMIFGIPLGENFNLPKCAESYPLHVLETCWTYKYLEIPSDERRLLHFPKLTWGHNITAYIENGILNSVSVQTLGVKTQDSDLKQLKDKFGAPTEFRVIREKNLYGASFSVYHARWNKPDVFVQFDADGSSDASNGKIDSGWVSITTSDHHKEFLRKRSEFFKSLQKM